MTKVIFCGLLSLYSAGLLAQRSLAIIDSLDKRFPKVIAPNKKFIEDGQFSHPTSRGKVYILPIDNMPCLVPDMNYIRPMPGSYKKFPESRMPNALPRQKLIPDDNRQKKSP
jgi:hypothetical protein